MYLFECEAVVEADRDAVWKVRTDVAGWPEWDVSKEIAQLDGPFEPGAHGWARQRGNLGGPFTEEARTRRAASPPATSGARRGTRGCAGVRRARRPASYPS